MVLALEGLHLLIEVGLDVSGLELEVFQRLDPPLHDLWQAL